MSKTFICYRKKPDISCDGAQYIYDLVKNGDLKGKFSPALFEDDDCVHERFDNKGYEKNISESEYFIVSICDGFFDDLIDHYKAFNENRTKIQDTYRKDEANARVNDLVKDFFDNACIAYQELAFATAEGKMIYPFLVFESEEKQKAYDDKSMIFFMNQEKCDMVKQAVNVLLCACGKDDPHLLGDIFCQTNVPKIVLKNNENGNRCVLGEESLINNFLGERLKKSFDRRTLFNTLEEHLGLIENTVVDHANLLQCSYNEPDAAAYYDLALDQDDHYFCITNAFINGVNYLKDTHENDELGVGRGFFEVKEACGAFPQEKEKSRGEYYCYWPVELRNMQERNPKKIHICAVCFGAIMLNNALKSNQNEVERYRNCINGAMNLLLTLRYYKDASWIHSWNFGEKDDVKSKEGTVNQTTLSIATLLTCGFVDCQDKEQLKKRFLYVYKSLRWLDEKGKTGNSTIREWKSRVNDLRMNLSLTFFALDAYDKYHEKVVASPIKDDPEIVGIVSVIEEGVIATLNGLIQERNLLDSPRNLRDVLKISKLLKSLCGSYNTIDSIIQKNEGARAIAEWAHDAGARALTLLSQVDDYLFDNITWDDVMESFPFNAKNEKNQEENDEYENCLELLYVDAIFVAVKTLDGMPEVKKAAIEKAYHVLWEYICKHVKKPENGEYYVFIKGRRTEHPPIYAYYYYQMVINDFKKLPEEYKNEIDENCDLECGISPRG